MACLSLINVLPTHPSYLPIFLIDEEHLFCHKKLYDESGALILLSRGHR